MDAWQKVVLGDQGIDYLVRRLRDRAGEAFWTCTCPDHQYRRRDCKHIRRAIRAHERERSIMSEEHVNQETGEVTVVSGGQEEQTDVHIDPKYVVDLKGKDYPTWPGVLDALHEQGLASISSDPIQMPCEANGWSAIVRCRITLKDGRFCEGIGDANPKNTRMDTALMRMAETRAKGRAGRDLLNVAEVLAEELPPDAVPTQNTRQTAHGAQRAHGNGGGYVASPAKQTADDSDAAAICAAPDCGTVITKNQNTVSRHKFGAPLCPKHQNDAGAAAAKSGQAA